MRLPNRKYSQTKKQEFDPYITEEKYKGLQEKLKKLTKVDRLRVAKEVAELALDGDFSENAGYQAVKHNLRNINNNILRIEKILKYAKIIEKNKTDKVAIGDLVTVEVNNKRKKLRILGSSEVDPANNIISHNSPIGSKLINKKINNTISIKINNKTINYKIINIE